MFLSDISYFFLFKMCYYHLEATKLFIDINISLNKSQA